MTIPLEQGFTVVTGPNGSGKSNILDGVLFCLGLATSRGMRADRLPDLINSGVLKAGKAAETEVSVRFDLSDWHPDSAEQDLEIPEEGPWIKPNQKEWTVTRRLRVMPGGSYSSSYSADGEACNLQQLQTQLRRLRIDPEGSNVVMQGDVTRIVSMSNRDRRVLIDELAGVALFDRRIEQTHSKLTDVQEKQERCRIVEQELITARHRLEKDCAKARTYQELREQLHSGRQQELVIAFETAKQGLKELQNQHQLIGEKEIKDEKRLIEKGKSLKLSEANLKSLQETVKALGEDQLIAVQAELAGLETQSREMERQASQHQQEGEQLQKLRQELKLKRQELTEDAQKQNKGIQSSKLEAAEQACKDAEASVELSRRRLGEVAGRSGEWLDHQRQRSSRRQQLQSNLTPLQQEQQQLEERLRQDASRQKELEEEQIKDNAENQHVINQLEKLDLEWGSLLEGVNSQKKQLQEAIDNLSIQERTRNRLEQEQARLEREIAKLESRRETLQESRGTGALRLLLESGLEGIHGAVAKLGDVENIHRLALEVAAGARLSHIVVDDESIAARAIELLKRQKAGRLTFLPLNKIRFPSNTSSNNKALVKGINPSLTSKNDGFIGKAVDLVKFEPIYKNVFGYIFGETLVFDNLDSAKYHLGRTRAVTLDGELLEKSGAMTGGSLSRRHDYVSFGSGNEGDEAAPLRKRLLELGETLIVCRKSESRLNKAIDEARPLLRKLEQRQAALKAEKIAAQRSHGPLMERRNQRSAKLNLISLSKEKQENRVKEVIRDIAPLILELDQLNKEENIKETKEEAETWQKLQALLETADKELELARITRDELLNEQRQCQLNVQHLVEQQKALESEEHRLQDAVEALSTAHGQWKEQQKALKERRGSLESQQKDLQIRFGEKRRERDIAEADVADQRQKLQEAQWKLQKLREDQLALSEQLRSEAIRLNELEQKLPNPLPDISQEIRVNGLEALQNKLEKIQGQMEALEPVNMLALEELEALEKRLGDLGERLDVLSQEREELLNRIENVATLRQEAFMEAFKAVDQHFREIFGSLSEGDGHLQLDSPDNPLEGGLTLVAHPKGKAVRRLAAMSGGEKSLTALSFLFALQRFRPSPFYALDEVDSFLDGVNVERLSALIASQAEQAQFLVVSHRRPMIGASRRTIGVTQARGAHTQVVGLPDAA